jgi:hypothetical protein
VCFPRWRNSQLISHNFRVFFNNFVIDSFTIQILDILLKRCGIRINHSFIYSRIDARRSCGIKLALEHAYHALVLNACHIIRLEFW